MRSICPRKIFATFLLASGIFGLPLRAQEQPGLDRKTPVVKVYEKTNKAVISITGERLVTSPVWPNFDWPDGLGLWGPRYQRQVKVLGSGVVVHEDGYIITNAHVVEAAQKVTIIFSDGREFAAKIVSTDQTKDLAVLTLQTDDKLPFIHLGRSHDLMIGETVIAIGNPYGYVNTVTTGVISALGRDIEVTEGYWLRGLIQTDAPINPGNSGGPLMNINGDLIGVTTAIRAEAQNIGFAIPVDTLADNLSHMLMPENLRRVSLGLIMGRMQSIGELTGLVIDSVIKASPADEKGLTAGDIVLEIDGGKLTGEIDFYVKIRNKQVGQPIQLKCLRRTADKSDVHTVELTLLSKPLPDSRKLATDLFQMEVSELTKQVARKFEFESAYPILIVTDVDPDGSAGQAGLKPGDLVLQINNATVRNLEEFSLEMEKITEGDKVNLRITRISVGVFGQVQRQFLVVLKAEKKKPSRYAF